MSNRDRWTGNGGRKALTLFFVTVSVFCIIFFAAPGRFSTPMSSAAVSTVLAPLQELVSWVGSQVNYMTSTCWEIYTVHEQNKMLRNEVAQLREQNVMANEYAAENERLRELLGYKNAATQFDLLPARVIGRESATWSSMIVIDQGTMSGVHENMAVVTQLGLVGHITESGPNSSKVQLILDPRSSVGTLVQRPESRVTGIVEGDMENPTMPRMVSIPKTADVVENDIIVTSGFGGVFPKGIVVGRVQVIKNEEGGLLKYAVLEPAVNFQKLEEVAVIVSSREKSSQPMVPPAQTPGTETNPNATGDARR